MTAKLTKEIVNQRLKSRGIKLTGHYTGARDKTTFRCPEGHQWMATPDSVARRNGCPHCAGKAPLSKEIVNQRLESRGIKLIGHYDGAMKKTLFQCPEGHEWLAIPNSVMSGNGCPHCAGNAPLSKKIINEKFAERGILIVSEYTGARAKSTFRCSEGHEWLARPYNVMGGRGCPTCAKYGFDPSKPAILYYLRFDTDLGPLWKIGITNRTLEERFIKEKTPFEIVKQWQYEDGSEALKAETEILSTFKQHKYNGPPVLRDGNSELFESDIFCLEKAA